MNLKKILPLLMLSLLAVQVEGQNKKKSIKPAVKTIVSPILPDSLLKEQLTRAVLFWKEGKAVNSYLSLDSINNQILTPENSTTKIKAAIWTATYLLAQKKLKVVPAYLDSALNWSRNNQKVEEQKKAFEVYVEYFSAIGNTKAAIATQKELFMIKDSINQQIFKSENDSLTTKVSELKEEIDLLKGNENKEQENAESDYKNWAIILGIISAVLLLLIFILNGNLQRLKNSPPAPKPSTPRVIKPEIITEKPEVKIKETENVDKKTEGLKTNKQDTGFPKIDSNQSASSKSLTARLSEVELVLIRPDVLSNYGDQKSIRSLLTEYNAQLPLILKNLDDAIATGETEPIVHSMEYMKPYLSAFGMLSTLSMIKEVEEEAATSTSKVTKLLSRVFQVRNHCRRALDESKSLMEKIG